MSSNYKSHDFDEYTYYVTKAHELRAQQWRRAFAALFRAPGWLAGKAASVLMRNFRGGRTAS